MKSTRHLLVSTKHLVVYLTLGIAVLAPAYAILANTASATAATTWTVPVRGSHHGGPDYWSITGARVGAPSEQEVSVYGGSHKHLWVEQQLYGPGVVEVPHVDTTVHQSR
jgi:hypothetical protein